MRAASCLLVIGDRRVLNDGAAVAGVVVDVEGVAEGRAPTRDGRPALLGGGRLDPAEVRRGVATREGGAFALASYHVSLRLAAAGATDAVCYTPFNKAAMRLAEPRYADAAAYTKAVLGHRGEASEFNVLGRLRNARVTSHISLSGVASRGMPSCAASGSPAPRSAPPASPSRASPWRHSTCTPATAATSGARRSTASRLQWSRRARKP